jgi:hypothetical protein
VTAFIGVGDIGGGLDRRQGEFDRALAAWRQDALDAQPQRRRVACQRELDGLAGQGLGLALEQCRGDGRFVARAGPAPGGMARAPLFERPPTRPPRRFW